MKARYYLFFVLLFVLSSCDSISGEGELKKDLYQGTSGVEFEIFDLPSEVSEDEEIPLIFRVENKGPYVTKGRIVINTEKDYVNIKGMNNYAAVDFNLDGKTVLNDIDDFEIYNVPLLAGKLDPLSEEHDTYLSTYLCYEYKGLAYADVCVDTDPYEVSNADKACKAQSSISLSGGQGGPVIIESVEPNMLINGDTIRPQFKIYIQNVGQGTVIQSGSIYQVCSKDSLNLNTYNTVSLSEVEISGKKLSGGQIQCVPSVLQLRNEKDFVTCTVAPGSAIPRNTLSYKSPLKIEINYGYMQALSKEISIRKILTY